jgi:hypothetical protein
MEKTVQRRGLRLRRVMEEQHIIGVTLRGTVFIDVRSGVASRSAYEQIEHERRRLLLQAPRAVGALIVVCDGVEIELNREIVERQKSTIWEFLAEESTVLGAVALGTEPQAVRLREAMRAIAPGHARLHVNSVVPAAALWLARELQTRGVRVPPEEIVEVVDGLMQTLQGRRAA